MAKKIDKVAVFGDLRKRLSANLARLTDAQSAAQAGTVHSEAKQEHPKDTRSIEAGYLSRGLAERVETLQDEVNTLATFHLQDHKAEDPIDLGTLVGLEDAESNTTTYFLLPVGGGEKLKAAGTEILCVTPRSPLGAALVGHEVGDEITVQLADGKKVFEVSWLS